MKKLEQLLNSLIEKGWKPFGIGGLAPYVEIHGRDISLYKLCDDGMREWLFDTDIRAVLSIDSGLWQFVCENDYWVHKDTYFAEKYTDHTAIHLYQCNDYRYWLIGSALTDEDKLEDFLLSNIKVGNED